MFLEVFQNVRFRTSTLFRISNVEFPGALVVLNFSLLELSWRFH